MGTDIHECHKEAEMASIKTTMDRVNKYMSEFSESIKHMEDTLKGITSMLDGNGVPGIKDEVITIKRVIKEHEELNKKLDSKLEIIEKYEKLLKWVLYVGVPTVAFNLGKILFDLIRWAIKNGYNFFS